MERAVLVADPRLDSPTPFLQYRCTGGCIGHRPASAEDVARLHVKDLEVQEKYGVRFLTYWYDAERRTTLCLVDAPDKEEELKSAGWLRPLWGES